MPRPALLSASLAALLSARSAAARPCAAFDTDGNLYAFGGSSDVALGANSAWGSPSAKPLSTSGRPPWTGNATQCFTSQYNNALYVVQADEKNPGDLYLYDFAKDSWTNQATSGAPDLDGASSVLDHDTNIVYTLTAAGEMWSLDTSSLTTVAGGSTIKWNDVGKAGIDTSGYRPTLQEASQHIVFFGVPGVDAGQAPLFVIHFSFFQPAPQAFPTKSGPSLPTQHGQVAGIPFSTTSVAGDQILYVPDDFSSAYVVTHWTNPGTVGSTDGAPDKIVDFINTTQTLAAPTSKDVNAVYAASTSDLVQLDSAGNIYYIANAIQDFAVSSSASWTKMSYTLPGLTSSTAGGNSSSSNSSSSGSSGSSSSGGSSSSSSSGSSGDDDGSSGAGRLAVGAVAVVLSAAAMLL